MFVFIPGYILPLRFGPGGTDSPDGSISPVTYMYIKTIQMYAHYTRPVTLIYTGVVSVTYNFRHSRVVMSGLTSLEQTLKGTLYMETQGNGLDTYRESKRNFVFRHLVS